MSYSYREMRATLLAPENVSKMIQSRDKILTLVRASGAITGGVAAHCWPGGGESWVMMAVADWMVEEGDLREIVQLGTPAGQNRIYRLGRKHT